MMKMYFTLYVLKITVVVFIKLKAKYVAEIKHGKNANSLKRIF